MCKMPQSQIMASHLSQVMFSGEFELKLTLRRDYFSVYLPYVAVFIPAEVQAQPNLYLYGNTLTMTILTCYLKPKS